MKIPRAFFLAIFALLIAGFSTTHAQPAPDNRITVSGTGEIRIAPDMAVLTVEAAFTRNTPRAAAEEVRKTMGEVLRIARKAVRDTLDLRTARVSLHPEYGWNEGKRIFQGYVASQSLEITLRDLGRIEGLLDELFRTSISGVAGPDFRHSNADSLQRAAGALAMRDAGENARTLCAAVNRSCEELIAARMTAFPSHRPFPAAEFKALRADAGGGIPVQPGTLTFSATVEADYRLQ